MQISTPIRIYVVDDHQMFADGLVQLLASEADFKFAGRSSTVAEAMLSLRDARADVVLLDVQLPDGDGYSVHEWLNKIFSDDAPLILYVSADDHLISINRAMSLGASDRGSVIRRCVCAATGARSATATPRLSDLTHRHNRANRHRRSCNVAADGLCVPDGSWAAYECAWTSSPDTTVMWATIATIVGPADRTGSGRIEPRRLMMR